MCAGTSIFASLLASPSRTQVRTAGTVPLCIQERQEGASRGRALCPHLLGQLCPDLIGQSWVTWPPSCKGAWKVGARNTVNPLIPSPFLSLSPHFHVFLLPVALPAPGVPQWTVHGLLGPCCQQVGARDAQRAGQGGNRRAQLSAPLGTDWEGLDWPGLPRDQVEVALTYCPAHSFISPLRAAPGDASLQAESRIIVMARPATLHCLARTNVGFWGAGRKERLSDQI